MDPADRDEWIDEVRNAVDMLDCPYLRHFGKCVTGCREEPRCITEEPMGGWEGVLIEAEQFQPGIVRAAIEPEGDA